MPVSETTLFKVGDVYTENIKQTASVVVNQGGTSSGKTYSILQVLFAIASQYVKKDIEGFRTCIITVVGQDIPNLKRGALRQALEIVENSLLLQRLILSYNKTDRIFLFRNGAKIEFNAYENAFKAKSGKRQYCFINECNGIGPEIYHELQIRTDFTTFLDYNPNEQFWVHEQLIGQPGVKLIISYHVHNPFLTQAQHDKIEGIKDKELWWIYARGKTGRIEGLVFRWNIADIPEHAKLVAYGMDFGFTNDPTTLVGVYMSDGELYCTELLYQRGLHTGDINIMLKELGVKPSDLIIADSADPKTISELGRLGWNIEGAEKGPDSIINGIDILKRYTVNMTVGSMNLRKETSAYKWKIDPKTSKPLNIPVDFMNHLIDPIRYVALNRLTEGKKLVAAEFKFRKRRR